MSIVHVIDTVREWAEQNICSKVRLKQPPADLDAPIDAGYDYTLVNPAAFAMYPPTAEKLPPNIHSPFPALCVGIQAGQDELTENKGYIDLQITFSAWDPGIHDHSNFSRNGDGWRDAWNFVDTAIREVESVTKIGGFIIDQATPVKFGPLTEQESIPDLYPFWFAWISFRVTYPLRRNIAELQVFL